MDVMMDSALKEIERIRRDNNRNWMAVLRIALEYAPEETKRVLKMINEDDQQISKLLGRLADDPT